MKKKLFSFVLAFAFILTAGICFTACRGDHTTFDMFNKTYRIGSTATYEFTVGGRKVADWEGYIRNNYANIANTEEYDSADAFIAHLNSQINAHKFIKGATITIGEGQVEGTEKIGSLTVKQGDMAEPLTFQLKATENKEYKGEYTNGGLYKDDNWCGLFAVSCNAKAKILEVEINFTLNENEYGNRFGLGFTLEDGTFCDLIVRYQFY